MIQLIGTNPREEAPVLNARIRKAWLRGAEIGLIGENVDLTYDVAYMGDSRADLLKLLDIDYKQVLEVPSVIVIGQGAINEADGEAVLATAMKVAELTDSKFMVLHSAASRVGAMDVGAVCEGGMAAATEGADVIYNMGADELDIDAGPFVIYQGSHGDRGAHRADVILPGAAYTEEAGLFVNTEGRPQLARRAAFPPGEAKENWAILRALSAELGMPQGWDSQAGLRAAMIEAVPHLGRVDEVIENEWKPEALKKPAKATFRNIITDFYLTNPIARASEVMAALAALEKERETKVAAE